MQPVASTMLSAVGYDAGDSKLYVEFKNGDVWEYDDVPEDMFDALTGGGSAGAYFRNHIRNEFNSRRV